MKTKQQLEEILERFDKEFSERVCPCVPGVKEFIKTEFNDYFNREIKQELLEKSNKEKQLILYYDGYDEHINNEIENAVKKFGWKFRSSSHCREKGETELAFYKDEE